MSATDADPVVQGLDVLVVDDSRVHRTVAVRLLRRGGHRVTVAHDGRQAVSAVKRHRYDVVLMDVEMPVLNGCDATRAIRHHEAFTGRRTPVVAVTAGGSALDCADAGMDAFLVKPLNAESLDQTLRLLTRVPLSVIHEHG